MDTQYHQSGNINTRSINSHMLTPAGLHFMLQGIDNQLPTYNNGIYVDAIADQLQVNTNELFIGLNILKDLCFLNIDRKNEKVRLTFTGRYATAPQ